MAYQPGFWIDDGSRLNSCIFWFSFVSGATICTRLLTCLYSGKEVWFWFDNSTNLGFPWYSGSGATFSRFDYCSRLSACMGWFIGFLRGQLWHQIAPAIFWQGGWISGSTMAPAWVPCFLVVELLSLDQQPLRTGYLYRMVYQPFLVLQWHLIESLSTLAVGQPCSRFDYCSRLSTCRGMVLAWSQGLQQLQDCLPLYSGNGATGPRLSLLTDWGCFTQTTCLLSRLLYFTLARFLPWSRDLTVISWFST